MEHILETRAVAVENNYPMFEKQVPQKIITAGNYQLRFARTPEELEEVQALRTAVFNYSLQGKIFDSDKYDEVFHHLLVRHMPTGKIVGTYRMQTCEMAAENYGFFSDTEYCLASMPQYVLESAVEIGRACVDEAHRNGRVLHLLWRGLAAYLAWNDKRYLFGCSSLFSQNPNEGFAILEAFRQEGQLHESIWVTPREKYTCCADENIKIEDIAIPKLLRVYMMFGAKVCSPPALDTEFRSIDFLTLFDLRGLSERAYNSFFAD